jgi:1,2-phenylacetyl-CoA epoxidase PaaB subunit
VIPKPHLRALNCYKNKPSVSIWVVVMNVIGTSKKENSFKEITERLDHTHKHTFYNTTFFVDI